MIKTITIYMVYGTSKDRKTGESCKFSSEEKAVMMCDTYSDDGWDAYYIEQTWEENV